jgi:DNA-binding transcriptional LysR family regulator
MDWDDVRVFLAVAQAASLAQGARAVGLDRSTASRRLAALEAALGAQLFVRAPGGLRLTTAGRRLTHRAEAMGQAARAMLAEATLEQAELAGTVRVATTEAFAVLLVQEGLLALRAQHPQLVVELLGGNRPLDIARGEADLALRVSPVKEAHVKVRRVARLGLALFASEDYVRRRGAPASPKALAGHDVVLLGGELAVVPEAQWLASQPGVQVAFRSSSMSALLAAVSGGAGIGAFTDAWGARTEGLRRLFALEFIEPRPLFLATAPEAAARPAVRVVADHIAEILGRLTAKAPKRR